MLVHVYSRLESYFQDQYSMTTKTTWQGKL